MAKTFIITIAAIVAAASIWLGVLYIKISRLNAAVGEMELIIAARDKSIAEAHAAIDIQNGKIAAFKADAEKTAAIYKEEQARISARYEYLLKKAKEQAGDSPTCEATLKAITDSQREFLYE